MDKNLANKLKSLSILYAEDEDNIRSNIVESLKYYVKEVIEAKDGLEAFKAYQQYKPDIVYTDIIMPKLSGVEFVQKIRNEDKITPIVMITASDDKKHLLDAVSLHLEQYIIKPVNLTSLKQSLYKCVLALASNKSLLNNLRDGYTYNHDKKSLFCHEKAIPLTAKESLLFELLLQNHHRFVTFNEIASNVWNDAMSQNALKSLLKNLKKKFPYIKNLSSVGYKLDIDDD